ncbi:phosphotransferase [Flindersiella endophytica]
MVEPDWAELGFGVPASVEEQSSLNDRTWSAIVTFRSGGRLFVKANSNPRRHEAGRYRALAGTEVPVPRLLRVVEDRPPVEVIALECLSRVGVDLGSDCEVSELLRVTAVLNAARPAVALAAGGGTPQASFEASVRAAIQEVAAGEADRWWDAYRRSAAEVDAMPTALCHGEFYFHQVGWAVRDGEAALVVFDLETLAYRPRFADIGSILFPLAEATGRTQRELLAAYLGELRRHTGVGVEVEVAFAELRTFRWVDACWGLPWLLRQHAAGAGEVSLESGLRCMREDLAALGG